MLSANWGVAHWAENPELPPTRWDTCTPLLPPEERTPLEVVTARIAHHARVQDATLTREERDRPWPRYGGAA